MSSSSVHEIEFENDSCYSLESSFSSYDSTSDNILFADNTSPNTFINSSNINPCFEIKNPYHKRYHHQHLSKLNRTTSHDRGCLSDHEKQNLGGISQRIIADSSSCFNVISSPRAFSRWKLWCGSFSFTANQNLSSVHAPIDYLKRKMIGQQKKEELEREVYVLHKMLAHEEKVHQYLEGLRQHSSAADVPNFLPPKMKELLAELSMVENEVARLETQINQLQSEVQREREATYKQVKHGTTIANSSAFTKKSSDKVALETNKAFHFINKPMKQDYSLSNRRFSENRQNPNGFSSSRENNFREDRFEDFGDKASKRSGIIMKSPFPLRETIRHSTCHRRDRNNLDPSTELPPEALLTTPLHSEQERIQRRTPNKLSEDIMKCLVSIYIRLLRTSKVMELERSGPIARSRNFFFSFRAETSSSSRVSQIIPRQQDPYGTFDSEESIRRDIGPYKNLARFTSSSMDAKCIQNSSSLRLFQKLKVLMDGLEKVDLRFLSHQQKLAFWINMHNACIMHGFLQYGVPHVFSREDMLVLINKATLNIAGNTINAQEIERFILRKPAEDLMMKEVLNKGNVGSKQKLIGEIYGLETPEPNITFALCCGTHSSPSVKIYTAEGITSELEKSKLEYLQAAIIVKRSKQISIPELLLRNMNNFARDKGALIEWLCHQLPASGSLRKSIVDCFRGSVHAGNNNKTAYDAVVEKTPYDFEFQYLLPV